MSQQYFYENTYFNTVTVCIQLLMTKSLMYLLCYYITTPLQH